MDTQSPLSPPHMSPEQFRRAAHDMVEWIINYHEHTVHEARVHPGAALAPGDVLRSMPAHPPETGEPWADIARDIDRVVMPGMTHWQAPGFHAFFPSAHSYPALLGEMLCASLGAVGFLWSGCPAMTEVETRVLDWLGELIGLPPAFLDEASGHKGGGVIQGTASEAVLVAMLAARARCHDAPSSVRRAPPGGRGPLTAYASTQAHSSVIKAAMVCGVGRENVRLIEVDDSLAMRPDALAAAIAADRADGRRPFFVCATVGTTSTTAIDPLRPIGDIARRDNLWLHCDAAYAGAAMVCPEFRWMIDGVELCDSFNFNPHKGLLTTFDCSTMWVRDRRPLIDAMSITPEYLRNKASESGAVIDYRDWQVPLGRRFRALKLWFVLRHYGAEGLRAHIREHVRLAALLEQLIRDDPQQRFEVVTPRVLGLVCLRRNAPPGPEADAATRRVLERINSAGRAFLTHSVIPLSSGRGNGYVIRVSIGAYHTREEHIRGLWDALGAAAN